MSGVLLPGHTAHASEPVGCCRERSGLQNRTLVLPPDKAVLMYAPGRCSPLWICRSGFSLYALNTAPLRPLHRWCFSGLCEAVTSGSFSPTGIHNKSQRSALLTDVSSGYIHTHCIWQSAALILDSKALGYSGHTYKDVNIRMTSSGHFQFYL